MTPARPSAPLFPALLRLPDFLALALAVFFLGFGVSLAMPFMSLFGVNRVGMTPLQLGVFLTLNAVSAVLISTQLARWSDRMASRRPLVLLCLGFGVAGNLALSQVSSLAAAILAGVGLLGVGSAAFPQLFAFARTHFSGGEGDLPERALTVLRAMFSLAWVVGPGLGAWAVTRWSYPGAFLLAALCLTLAASAVAWSRRGGRRREAEAGPLPAPSAAPNTRPVHWVAVAFALYGMSMSMGMTMFPLFITKTLSGTTGEVGFLIGLCALLEIPVMLALVTLRRLPGVEWLVRAAMFLFAVHFLLVYLAQGMALLVVTQAVRAVVLAVLAGLGMTYFQSLMPGRIAAATTLFSNTINVGGMLAGLTAGSVAQVFGYRDVYLVCAALTFGGWVVMPAVTRRRAPDGTTR